MRNQHPRIELVNLSWCTANAPSKKQSWSHTRRQHLWAHGRRDRATQDQGLRWWGKWMNRASSNDAAGIRGAGGSAETPVRGCDRWSFLAVAAGRTMRAAAFMPSRAQTRTAAVRSNQRCRTRLPRAPLWLAVWVSRSRGSSAFEHSSSVQLLLVERSHAFVRYGLCWFFFFFSSTKNGPCRITEDIVSATGG